MSLQSILQAGGLAARVDAATYTDSEPVPNTSLIGIRLDTDGGFDSYDDGIYTYLYDWKTGGGVVGDYSCRWTSTVGTLSSGMTSGTWYALSTAREAVVSQTLSGTKTCTGTLDIAATTDTTNILASASITLTATHV